MRKQLLLLGLLLAQLSFADTYVIPIAEGTAVADVQTAIASSIGSDAAADVILQFADGKSYFGGTDVLIIPVGVSNLTLIASVGSNTTVNMKSVTLGGILTALTIQNLKLITTSSSTNLVGQSATAYPKALFVNNCSLSGYRGVFAAAAGEKISVSFDHCTFKSIGSYGLINGGSMLKDVTYTYCTFINLATLFSNTSWAIDASNPFTLRNCTFYNSTTQITNGFFRPAANPTAGAIIDKNIVASTVDNISGLMYSSTGYSGLDFVTSFKTSNYTGAKLTNIQSYTGTATDIFNDPENGDFSFKSTVTGDILKCGANASGFATSVESTKKSLVKIFPGNIVVDGQNVHIRVYTISGELLIDNHTNRLSTLGLSNGIYVVKVTVDGQSVTQKLHIQEN